MANPSENKILDTISVHTPPFSDGAVEREILTQITDGILNLVFDGWAYADGRAVVIQTVPLGPDVTNVNVRFEDI